MFITGGVKIHLKTVQREADAAFVMPNGAVAVWDNLPDDYSMTAISDGMVMPEDSEGILEPDAIGSAEEWERIHKTDSYWKPGSSQHMEYMAKKSDENESI